MTAIESDVQWYIARDGKQYGPVSAVEMAKLVELRHLRPNDLVWRPGFADWRPALTVFPPEVTAPQAPQSARPVTGAPAPAQASTGTPRQDAVSGISPADIKAAADTRAAAHARPSETRASGEHHAAGRASPKAAKKGSGGTVIAAAVLLLLAVGGGAGYYLYGARLGDKAAKSATPAAKATVAGTAAPTVSVEAVESRVQNVELWRLLRRDYADWYAARMKELESLPGDQRTESSVDKLLVDQIMALRRKHADQALSASTAKLKRVAIAFLDNINELASHDPGACFSFISMGESSPAVMPGIVRSDGKAAIQTQLMAIFEAIAEGAKAPVQHDKPQKADYDALAGELTRLGWSQTDLQLFADPKALARATPERVCKMVQDWFTAHIAISDPGVQERLLVETLRPVVSG